MYWILGCLIIGYSQGKTIIECQSVNIDSTALVYKIAIWPSYFGMALAGTAPESLRKSKCGESQ